MVARPLAGSIVLVDWRGGALPREPAGRRPAVVVEDSDLVPDRYPNLLVVPLTRDERFASYGAFVQRIDPSPENGAPEVCWALAHHVTSVSLARVNPTPSVVSARQLRSIRARAVLALGFSGPSRTLVERGELD
jgi:mRNA interferase MazF